MNPLEQLLQLAGIQKPSGYDALAARSTPPGMENLGTLPQERAGMMATPEQAAQMQRIRSSPGIMGDLRKLAGLGVDMGDGVPRRASGGFGNDLGSLGAGMMMAGSRPGATFLGALGEGLTTMAAGSRQRKKDELAEAREERVARLAEEELGLKRQTAQQTLKDKQRAERNAALALVIPANRPLLAKLIDEGKIDPTDSAGVYDLITKNNMKLLPKLEKVGDRLVDTSAETPRVVLGAQPKFQTFREGDQDVTYQINDDGSRTRVAGGAAFKPERQTPEGGAFRGNAMDAQASNILLTGDPASREYGIAYTHLYGPKQIQQPDGTTIVMTPPVPEGIVKPRAGALPVSSPAPAVPDGAPQPPDTSAQNTTQLPGGGSVTRVGDPSTKPQSAEAAARTALVKEGLSAVDTFRKRAISPNGTGVDRAMITSAWMNIPGTEGAQFRNLLENAIANRLRIETGAAITKEETKNMADRYLPRPYDTPDLARQKLDAIEGYFREFEKATQGKGAPLPAPIPATPAPAGDAPPPPPGFKVLN